LVVRAIEGRPLYRTVALRVVQGRRYSPALEAFMKVARVLDWTKSFPNSEESSGGCERQPRHIAETSARMATGRGDVSPEPASLEVGGSYRTSI
jgi:hypothetical protein